MHTDNTNSSSEFNRATILNLQSGTIERLFKAVSASEYIDDLGTVLTGYINAHEVNDQKDVLHISNITWSFTQLMARLAELEKLHVELSANPISSLNKAA